ncbi:uncharacterized protein VTP21DRAFT_9243 [Calcarisporiella thermophila]|uniref:uncharacterized protein n=1 Tax=Calcarisporiella thermophila TaxID=911321 RepID=UPI0037434E50
MMANSMDIDSKTIPIYTLRDPSPPAPLLTSEDYEESSFNSEQTPIVIDNGSYQCRAGWATETDPRLIFDNLASKFRDKKSNTTVVLAGNDIYYDPTARSSARSPFEGNVVMNFEYMEYIFDYIFLKLGINTDGVYHPIIMTEPVCNLQYNRKAVTELLFEGYNVPSITYGVDALFSYYYNWSHCNNEGFIISSGHNSTHVIPFLDGKAVFPLTKRISYGGLPAAEYMHKLLQLKYPTFPTRSTLQQSQTLVRDHAYVAVDYQSELREFEDPEMVVDKDRLIQFPFVAPVVGEKTEEEIARQAARRKEQAERLREQMARRRLEKLMRREQDLETFKMLRESKATERKADWIARLKELGFQDESELEEEIKRTEASIHRARNRDLGGDGKEEKEKPNFPLADVPDEELNEAERKEKRRQRLLKASYEARERARKAKEEEKALQEELQRQDEKRRQENLEAWLEDLRQKRQLVVDRINDRKRRRAQLSDRRSHASQMRMRSLASLVGDGPQTKRRRRGQGEDEDTFGADDQDWNVYKEISKEEDSDEEEEDWQQIKRYEQDLLMYDPAFTEDDRLEVKHSPQKALVHRLAHGVGPWDPEDLAQVHQMHLNVERIRVPEVLFQPSMIGLDQAGLVETIAQLLTQFKLDERKRLMQTVFLTGGFTFTPQFAARVEHSLRSLLPTDWPLKIVSAYDPMLDAYKGAAQWVRQRPEEHHRVAITRAQYEECGHNYLLKEYGFGNIPMKYL